ncbi:MAG TPA: NADP-dependent oxidoreductase [Chloroflexota bacterium]|nr:NADP-dependent oxidoreductase [Chloroflexota bacterium]
MLAIQQETFGAPEVLRLVEVERPEPLPTEVLVRVHAAGVNPVDWKTRTGAAFLHSLPLTVGWDVSGVVEQVGIGVTRFRAGDEVFGMPWFPRQAGAYAQYVTAPSRHFAAKPAGLSHTEAGGLPLAGLTAWQVLVDTARVEAGQRVLVTAAAGGVGHLAVQIAKARGAYVIGTARAAKHDFLRRLGVDEAIDYTQGHPAEVARELDLVFDPMGEDSGRYLSAIKPGGMLVPFGAGGQPDVLAEARERGVRTALFLVEPDHAGLEALASLVERGALRVEIDTVLPLAEAAKAHELSEAGRARGKIVLTV